MHAPGGEGTGAGDIFARSSRCYRAAHLTRFRRREGEDTGDGFLATLDVPAHGVRCACAILDEIKPLGIEIRSGLHAGECEMIGDDVNGIAVHAGAWVAALAGSGEILVSGMVKDLVAGSGCGLATAASTA
jgi:class 3 adenylate cyclase